MSAPLRILIAPLDWGIGHTTRIIPLVTSLLNLGCEVIIAADGYASALLEQEFDQVIFIKLEGYKIQYSREKKWFSLKIFLQTPRIFYTIFKEHNWLKKVVKNYSVDAVISDNRFGLYHRSIPGVYITHQLMIKTGNRFFEKPAAKLHAAFIKKFTQCWVPDFEGTQNLAGELSHPLKTPANVTYIGGLSRFEKHPVVEMKYDLLILLSGPEPQRSVFEQLLLPQLKQFEGKALLVRGLPGVTEPITFFNGGANNILIKNHLTAQELNIAIEQSAIVISRSGYTTIMDLIKLQKKAILVPTPGQAEQEYLADYLMQQNLFYSIPQKDFVLSKALESAAGFNFSLVEYDMYQYKKVVRQFIQEIRDRTIN